MAEDTDRAASVLGQVEEARRFIAGVAKFQAGETVIPTGSMLVNRQTLGGILGFKGARNYAEAYGYPEAPTFVDYLTMYRRNDIAGRLIDEPAAETWRNAPVIVDDDTTEEFTTPFEIAVDELFGAHRLLHRLERLDRLASIGQYAVLYIGLADGVDPSQPVPDRAQNEVVFFNIFSEQRARPIDLVRDEQSPRFGLPEAYQITIGSAEQRRSIKVHHSRIVHVVEGVFDSELYGLPGLERILNRLHDLVKIVGSSGEMYWREAVQTMHVNADPRYQVGRDELDDLRTQVDEMVHNLRRVVRTSGVEINKLGSNIADPRGPFNVIISLIAAAEGIPQRVLIGSERGELASSQDEKNWAVRIEQRQRLFAETNILRPLIDRLIELRVVPAPIDEQYTVRWPNLSDPTLADRVAVLERASLAASNFAASGAGTLMTVGEARERMLGWEPELPEDVNQGSGGQSESRQALRVARSPGERVNGLVSMLSIRPLLTRLTSEARRIVGRFGRLMAERIGFLDFSEERAVAEFLEDYAGERIAAIDRTTKARLAAALIEGVEAGEDANALAGRVRSLFTEMSENRARTIARNEVATAANHGHLAAMRQAGVAEKAWLSQRDGRVRQSHVLADGQIVGVDHDFIVGGWPAARPQDPRLPPAESVNCRCAAEPHDAARNLALGDEEARLSRWLQFDAELQDDEQTFEDAVRAALNEQAAEMVELIETAYGT